MGRYVILGNGVAGTRAAEMLRDLDQDAEIVVVTEEVHPFYRRPLLVDYVTGRVGVSLLAGRKKDFYEAKRIELLLDRRAESVDPAAKVVTLSDGKELGYDKLLVATGRKPVGPEDTQDDRIIYMKTLADADRIRGMSGRGRSAVVHGNGMLALEMVRAFTGVGFETTYLVPSERIWPDVLDIDAADIVASRVRSAGAEIMYSAEISEVQGEGRASGVALKSGHTVTADTVGIAGEYLPSVDFLPGGMSGYRPEPGYSTPWKDVFIAGDVTADPQMGHFNWLRSWRQGADVARAMNGSGAAEFQKADLLNTQVMGCMSSIPTCALRGAWSWQHPYSPWACALKRRPWWIGANLSGRPNTYWGERLLLRAFRSAWGRTCVRQAAVEKMCLMVLGRL